MKNKRDSPKGPSQIQYIFFTVNEALREFSKILSPYEQKEITAYPKIYYAGQRCYNKIQAPLQGPNYGYDNDNSEYKIVVHDHVAYRYEIVDFLGNGTFGQVIKAIDHATKTLVAIKIAQSIRAITRQAEVEVGMLSRIRDADPNDMFGLVQMLNSFMFRNHMCIVSELLGMDLYTYMEITEFKPMPIQEIRQIASMVLISLDFMWRENIIHRDLKPENIVFRSNDSKEVKIIDLGSACCDDNKFYSYIQSRFYRAPEVILRLKSGRFMDMWSFGCILCELATGYPIFAADHEKDQLTIIINYIGPPPLEMFKACANEAINSDANLCCLATGCVNEKARDPNVNMLASFLKVSPDDAFLNFVQQFLIWEPEMRAAPREAMKHPWLSNSFAFPKLNQGSDNILSSQLMPSLEESSGEISTFSLGHVELGNIPNSNSSLTHSQKTGGSGERRDSWALLETQQGAATEATPKEATIQEIPAAVLLPTLSSSFSSSELSLHYTMLSCTEISIAERNMLSFLFQKPIVRRTCKRPVNVIHAIIAQSDFTRNNSEITKKQRKQDGSIIATHGA